MKVSVTCLPDRAAPIAATLGRVLADITAERCRQESKWGQQNHVDGTGTLGSAEAADRARRSCQRAAAGGSLTWRHVLTEEVHEALAEADPDRLRAELVQIAAVATAWAEAIDRRAEAQP